MKKAVISLSGGMDSTGLLVHLLAQGYEVYALSFYYGQKHRVELERANSNIEYLKQHGYKVHQLVSDISGAMSIFDSALTTDDMEVPEGHYEQDNMKATVVPNRNAIFASVIYGYALSLANKFNEKVIIGLGVHSGDHAIYPDCRPEFYEAIEKAFKIGNWDSDRVDFYLPYLSGDKYTILRDAENSIDKLDGLEFDTIFANTNTSYNPDNKGRSSGKSGADVERILAFHQLGRKDPVEYVDTWENVLDDALQLEKEYQQGV
jgi:7-cyano-7-deazaguanine synthase